MLNIGCPNHPATKFHIVGNLLLCIENRLVLILYVRYSAKNFGDSMND